MKKLNNKGLTLIELIVSISLISVVMLFLYALLGNVTYESDEEFFASKNQEQRIEIVNYIENLMKNAEVSDVTIAKISGQTTIQFKQKSLSKTYTIIITSNNIKIKDATKTLRQWDIAQGSFSFSDTACKSLDTSSSSYVLWSCTIPVYTLSNNNSAANNNTIDDIIVSFLTHS